MLHVRRFTDPAEFLKLATPMLMRDEAPNCFFLGSLTSVREFTLLCTICDGDQCVAAAVMTPGYHLFMTAASREASEALVEFLLANEIAIPGVQSHRGDAEVFAQAWCARTTVVPQPTRGMGIYKLTRVASPSDVPGQLKVAEQSDVDLVTEWMEAFARDIGEPFGRPRENAIERIAQQRIFLWTNPQPVSMAAWAGPTPNGVRINLVYTPPQLRRHGYASACVAALSQRMLDSGKKFCILYTDLSNPTSNKIYQAIGYQHVRDDSRIFFKPANG